MTTLPKFRMALAEVTAQYRRHALEMRAQGHKQQYIASVLGVSQWQISRWLSGRTR